MNENEIYFFNPVELEIRSFPGGGDVLDIGGGGEGIIGKLKGPRVVAIDRSKDELAEAPEGPLKIVMDARELQFLDGVFSAATAFFSLMYFRDQSDLQSAFTEACRVLKPGGRLRIWDVDMAAFPETDKSVFAVRVRCVVNGEVCEAVYGAPWPSQPRDRNYYRTLAEAAGFVHVNTVISNCTFESTFRKC